MERLQKAGIHILSPQEQLKATGKPVLFVDVSLNQPKDAPVYAYNVTVALNQIVTLNRDPAIQVIAPTWSLGRGGMAGNRVIAAAVQRTVADLTEKFIAAHKGEAAQKTAAQR